MLDLLVGGFSFCCCILFLVGWNGFVFLIVGVGGGGVCPRYMLRSRDVIHVTHEYLIGLCT